MNSSSSSILPIRVAILVDCDNVSPDILGHAYAVTPGSTQGVRPSDYVVQSLAEGVDGVVFRAPIAVSASTWKEHQ